MLSDKLRGARDYEEKHAPFISEEEKPKYHITGAVGWINDPNGFSIYKGEYHLFFQYHPYDTKWGPMHWGHVKTKDFLKWERLPVSLAPDEEYDDFGCFSGSGIELPNGKHLLVYTGVKKEYEDGGEEHVFQTQCIAIGDGINYDKYEKNPVLSGKDLPIGGSTKDFRDPKIWNEGGIYYLVVGNWVADRGGAALLYESTDGIAWKYKSVLAERGNRYGSMWECPDFFSLDEKHVLLVSGQEMTEVEHGDDKVNSSVCLIGNYNREKCHLDSENVHLIDYGIDFYAPQTLETQDGRRIMIAWMQNWATCNIQLQNNKYFGEMTLPRELHVKNGRLFQTPVRELEKYRKNEIRYSGVTVGREVSFAGVQGRVVDLVLLVKPQDRAKMYDSFTINLAKDKKYKTTIQFEPGKGLICVDRKHCGYPEEIIHKKSFLVGDNCGDLKIRIILDRHSIELFLNDGEYAASFMIHTPQSAEGITFEAEGSVLMDIEKYDL